MPFVRVDPAVVAARLAAAGLGRKTANTRTTALNTLSRPKTGDLGGPPMPPLQDVMRQPMEAGSGVNIPSDGSATTPAGTMAGTVSNKNTGKTAQVVGTGTSTGGIAGVPSDKTMTDMSAATTTTTTGM